MSIIKTKPTFVKDLPAAQRTVLAPRQSDLQKDAAAFRDQLLEHRDEWALAATDLTSTSSIYEAFREAGCEVRVVRKTDKDGKVITRRLKNSKGVDTDYPVCDIYVLLPEGEIKNRSGRKPWVAPAKRLEQLRTDLKTATGEAKTEIETQIAAILERNPKLRS